MDLKSCQNGRCNNGEKRKMDKKHEKNKEIKRTKVIFPQWTFDFEAQAKQRNHGKKKQLVEKKLGKEV